jgi:hypothetical protein
MDHPRTDEILDGPVHATTPDGLIAVRASDDERETVARILNLAAGAGMLTLAETDERLGRVYAARTRAELVPLTADLPDHGRRLLEDTPEGRSAARSGLRRHTGSIVVVTLVLVAVWGLSAVAADPPHYFWPVWPLGFMWFGVLAHARRIRR